MTTQVKSASTSVATDRLGAAFLALLPRIERHASIHFRDVRCRDARADRVAETVALAWCWYVRLAERGRDGAEFAAALARFAARAVRSGRRVCGQEKSRDIMNSAAQRRFGFTVESLLVTMRCPHADVRRRSRDRGDLGVFEERLIDNTITAFPERAAFRIDFPAFVRTFSDRDRALAEFLSLGHSADNAARRFGVSTPRVSQLRKRWCRAWRRTQAEPMPDRARTKAA